MSVNLHGTLKIFLAPDRLVASEEYAESDPYGVEESIDGDFHTRRFDLTIDLIKEAVLPVERATPQQSATRD